MERIIPLFGIVVFIAIAFFCSSDRNKIPWSTVAKALLIQFAFAALILKTSAGEGLFQAIGNGVSSVAAYADTGSNMVFGSLSSGRVDVKGPSGENGDGTYADLGFILAFKAMPILIFFSALASLLYYIGVLPRIVKGMAWLMEKLLNISGAEALATAANIFIGQAEAPLIVKPYVSRMTRSELMTLQVGGMATIAGSVFAVYANYLSGRIEGIAGHLLAASVISAPAAILFAKMFTPETEAPETLGVRCEVSNIDDGSNVFGAIARGTTDGVKMAITIIGMLIAFVALMAMLNGIWSSLVIWIGSLLSLDVSAIDSLSKVVGYIFSPFALLMGIDLADCLPAGYLLAERMCLNEFIAYSDLANHINGSNLLDGSSPHEFSDRSIIILSYALCGFANFGSIGILIGGIGEIAPNKKKDLTELGLNAMIAATLATAMTACVAAVLI